MALDELTMLLIDVEMVLFGVLLRCFRPLMFESHDAGRVTPSRWCLACNFVDPKEDDACVSLLMKEELHCVELYLGRSKELHCFDTET